MTDEPKTVLPNPDAPTAPQERIEQSRRGDSPFSSPGNLSDVDTAAAAIVDGVYFELDPEVYHAVPRLSCSGIQKMCVSPATFWRRSWLDPDRPERDDDDTIWQVIGRAYHCARLEPHLFESQYVRDLDKADAPEGTLFTGNDMKPVLEEMGLKVSGKVEEQAERLAEAGFDETLLWPLIKREWEEARAGRTPLPAKHYDQMLTDHERITNNPQIAALLTGGEAEVSIFWTDRHGIQMKARIDYLSPEFVSDLKTFDNSRGKNVNQALTDALRYNRYYQQPAVYREAIEAVRSRAVEIIGQHTDAQRNLIATIRANRRELPFWFVFLEKGGVPNMLAREFPYYSVPYTTIFNEQITDDEARKELMREATKQRTQLFRLAEMEVINAKKLFVLYSQVYRPGEPWFPIDAVGRFSDDDFSPHWLEQANW